MRRVRAAVARSTRSAAGPERESLVAGPALRATPEDVAAFQGERLLGRLPAPRLDRDARGRDPWSLNPDHVERIGLAAATGGTRGAGLHHQRGVVVDPVAG